MKFLIAIALLFTHSCAFAAPFAVFPCQSGTPKPTECRMKVGAVSSTVPPHTGATSGSVFCVVDLTGSTGSVAVTATPANDWGAGPTATGTANMVDFSPPAALGAMQVLPEKPQ